MKDNPTKRFCWCGSLRRYCDWWSKSVTGPWGQGLQDVTERGPVFCGADLLFLIIVFEQSIKTQHLRYLNNSEWGSSLPPQMNHCSVLWRHTLNKVQNLEKKCSFMLLWCHMQAHVLIRCPDYASVAVDSCNGSQSLFSWPLVTERMVCTAVRATTSGFHYCYRPQVVM